MIGQLRLSLSVYSTPAVLTYIPAENWAAARLNHLHRDFLLMGSGAAIFSLLVFLIPTLLFLEQRPYAFALGSSHNQIHHVSSSVRELFQQHTIRDRYLVWRLSEAQTSERHDKLVPDTIEVSGRGCL